ncbi:TetR/AcrR family transcriptional regulator [uncultured Tistrella sp.]|uniref:TetR/AcrR family transcriptional regulator n=1 Tax=Tistrella mobilis TaxID=171437 RepID=UPI000C09D275|nr:TetR/AcrR family transcriptional regulator [uncultured Tistrella sp.]MAM74802.1 TetR family transcriptional regulator [Tistrella sp.]
MKIAEDGVARRGRKIDEAEAATRRMELLEAAANCFMRTGYHATSIDDVARSMGCTKGFIYHYHATKTDLFFDVHREGMRRLFAAVEPAMASAGDALAVLRAMLLAHARAMMDHHAFETVVAQGVQIHRFGATTPDQRRTLDDLIASRDRFEALFKAQTLRAAEAGLLGPVAPSIAVKMMLGALQWSIFWYRPEADAGEGARDRLAEEMVRTIIDGLRARPAAG